MSLSAGGGAGSGACVGVEAVTRAGAEEVAGDLAACCPRCDAASAMITPEEAAARAGVSTRQIFRWLEAGLLHFVETDGPWPLVCRPSLFAAARRETGAALSVELNGEQGR